MKEPEIDDLGDAMWFLAAVACLGWAWLAWWVWVGRP